MKHTLTLILAAVLMMSAAVFTSCQSKEERVISRLEKLADRISEHGADFTDEQWEAAANEFAKLQDEAAQCDFTREQARQLGRAEANIVKATLREGGKSVGRRLNDAFDQGAGMLEGFAEGLSDDGEDYEDLDEAYEELEDAAEGFVEGLFGE